MPDGQGSTIRPSAGVSYISQTWSSERVMCQRLSKSKGKNEDNKIENNKQKRTARVKARKKKWQKARITRLSRPMMRPWAIKQISHLFWLNIASSMIKTVAHSAQMLHYPLFWHMKNKTGYRPKDRRTDERTDWRTDAPSWLDARTYPKRKNGKKEKRVKTKTK